MAELKHLLHEAVPASAPTFDADDIRAGLRRARQRRQRVFGAVAVSLVLVVAAITVPALRGPRVADVASDTTGGQPTLASVVLEVTRTDVVAPGRPTPTSGGATAVAIGLGVGQLDEATATITVWCEVPGSGYEQIVLRDVDAQLPTAGLALLARQTVDRLDPACDVWSQTAALDAAPSLPGQAFVEAVAERLEASGTIPCCGRASTLSIASEAFGWGILLDDREVPFFVVDASELVMAGGSATVECGDVVAILDPTVAEPGDAAAVHQALGCAEPIALSSTPPPVPTEPTPRAVPVEPTPSEPPEAGVDPGASLVAAMEREGYGPLDVTDLEGGKLTFTYQPRESGALGLQPSPVWVLVDPLGADAPAVSADTALVRLLDGEAVVLEGGELHFTCVGVGITTTGPGAGGSSVIEVGELPAAIGCTPRPPGIPNELDRFQSIREARLQQVLGAMGIPPGELSGEPSHGGSDASYVVPFGDVEHILYAGQPRLDDPEFQAGPEIAFAGGTAHQAGIDDGLPGLAFECGDTYYELFRDHPDADALVAFGQALVDQLGCVPGQFGAAAD